MIRMLYLYIRRKSVPKALISLFLCTVIVAVFSSVGLGRYQRSYDIEPEYNRKLETVVMSLEINTESLSLHKDIMKSFPEYAEIILLIPQKRARKIRRELGGLDLQQKVRLIPFESKQLIYGKGFSLSKGESKILKNKHIPRGSVWAQDLFEVAHSRDGTNSLLAPLVHKWLIENVGDRGSNGLSDNLFLDKLKLLNFNIEKLPIAFKGGNVLIDHIRDRKVAFCGSDIIRETILVTERAQGRTVTKKDVVGQLKHYLNVDRVVVVGKDKQPEKMFHLDQAMVLFPGGVAGVTHIVDDEHARGNSEVNAVNQLLSELRVKLKAMGYRIVDIDATVEDVLNYRYYVNGVPYINKNTGRKEFLMPLFESSLKDKSILRKNVSAIEALGYKVITVHTHANERHGGIHCMVNVLS